MKFGGCVYTRPLNKQPLSCAFEAIENKQMKTMSSGFFKWVMADLVRGYGYYLNVEFGN